MRRISIGTELKFHDGTYLIAEVAGSTLKLRNLDTGNYITIHSSEVPLRLAEPPEYAPIRAGDLERASEEAVQEAEFWAYHLEETWTGIRLGEPDSQVPASPYDPGITNLKQRMQGKVAELEGLGLKTSVGTLKRKRAVSKIEGTTALLDRRKMRQESPLGRADERIVETLIRVIANEENESTGTVSRIGARLKEELLKSYPGEIVELPSQATLHRYVGILTKGMHTTGNAANRRSAAKSPKRSFGKRFRDHPGSEVQVDSSPWDILVLDEDGQPARAVLCIMVDVATRSIISTGVRLVAAKGVDIALVLARCIVPRQLRPGHGQLTRLANSQLQWRDMASEEDREKYAAAMPYIVPDRIVIDNGSDYRSKVFKDACRHLGISLTFSSPYTPTDKAVVERTFRSIKHLFAQHLPGFKGGSVAERGHRIEDRPLLDVYTLVELFEEWVQASWQNRPHDGLRDPMFPAVTLTPNEMYNAMFDVSGYVTVPFTADDYIALMPAGYRSIQADGITYMNRVYDSSELDRYRLAPSHDPQHKNQWEIRYNPYDPRAVWLRHPEDGHWIECLWRDDGIFERPFAAAVYGNARRIVSERSEGHEAFAGESTAEIIRRAKAAAVRVRKEEIRNETARKQEERSGVPRPELRPMPTTSDEVFDYDPDVSDAAGVPLIELDSFDPREGVS